jgi:hypothetical protein
MLKLYRVLWIFAALGLAGCQAGLFGASGTQPFPTFDPAVLSATPAPTVTPENTYTPYPTTVRIPSRTPPPTFAPVITLSPYTPSPSATISDLPTRVPTAVPSATSILGIPGVGPEIPELVPILTFEPIMYCHTWLLAQIGIKNIGSKEAREFDVQWYWGWGEPVNEHVEELGNTAGPLWFFNGLTAIQCDQTTTLTAWIKIDPDGKVTNEAIKTNNYDEQTYTAIYPTATPGTGN